MKKKYRIKIVEKRQESDKWIMSNSPTFKVQVRAIFGIWITVKSFQDIDDPDFANREAHELLEKLEEK